MAWVHCEGIKRLYQELSVFLHLKFGTYEPSGDNFFFNVHLKLSSLTLVIIIC